MTGNSNFQNPPVDLVGLKTDIDALSALHGRIARWEQKGHRRKEEAEGRRCEEVASVATLC